MKSDPDLNAERIEHNRICERQKDWLLDTPLTWERYYHRMCLPPHAGGTLYGLDHKIFLDYLIEELERLKKTDLKILDYGCGTGALSIALADKGYQLEGFDLSDKGIEIAQKAAKKAGVENKTNFVVSNAQFLPYRDETFDLVIGKAVLHHTIKYDGTDRELYRILKKGGKAVFIEGAAGNPLIAAIRYFTIRKALGDTPLDLKRIARFAEKFSRHRVKGYFFLYMLKRFGYYSSDETLPGRGKNRLGEHPLFQRVLKACLTFDEHFINEKRPRISGRYLIEIQK